MTRSEYERVCKYAWQLGCMQCSWALKAETVSQCSVVLPDGVSLLVAGLSQWEGSCTQTHHQCEGCCPPLPGQPHCPWVSAPSPLLDWQHLLGLPVEASQMDWPVTQLLLRAVSATYDAGLDPVLLQLGLGL